VTKIVVAIQRLLATQTDGVLALSAFRALRSIGLTLCSGEKSSITTIIPQILSAIKNRTATPLALAALSPLPCVFPPLNIDRFISLLLKGLNLGHALFLSSVSLLFRAYPLFAKDLQVFYRSIFMFFWLCSQNVFMEEILEDTYSILHGLLSSIPTFWGAGELNQAVTLYIDHCVTTVNTPSSPMSSLMKAITKRASPTILLPMMVEMWATIKVAPQLVWFQFSRERHAAYPSFSRIALPHISTH
jgi:U3 small nucleolar RNA-associated protein 10